MSCRRHPDPPSNNCCFWRNRNKSTRTKNSNNKQSRCEACGRTHWITSLQQMTGLCVCVSMKEVRAGTDLHSSNPQHGRLYEPRYASYYRAKDMRLPASLQDRVSIFTKVLESLPHLETGILSLHTTRSIGADVRHSRHDSSFKSPAKRWYRNKNPFQFLWRHLPVVDRPTFPDKLGGGGYTKRSKESASI